MYRLRVCTSDSRTESCARTCRCRSEVRCAGRYAPSLQASASVRASRRSVFTLRLRVAYMAAKFGSATTTSWPSSSRQRATHSLSVDASIRTFARGLSQHRGEPLPLRPDPPLDHLAASRQDADLAFHLVYVDANMLHGWPPPLRHTTACTIVGLRPPRVVAASRFIPSIAVSERPLSVLWSWQNAPYRSYGLCSTSGNANGTFAGTGPEGLNRVRTA